MKETILITGANSFIAKHIVQQIGNSYHVKLLTRSPKADNEYAWDLEHWTMDERALEGVQYIIHLSGSKLNDGTPLTEDRKKLVYDSRIGAANLLKEKLQARGQKIKSFVSASAIGYYGFTDDTLRIAEEGAKGFGFAADLSADWEAAADLFKTEGVANHVAKIRVSLVLGNESGIYPIYRKMLAGNPSLATQHNPAAVPWNHVSDMAGIFLHAVKHELDGVYNSVAPMPASQEQIFAAIANAEHQSNIDIKPFEGQHLVSDKLIATGYSFQYPDIQAAVQDLTNTSN